MRGNEPIFVNPGCELEAFGEINRAVEHTFGSMAKQACIVE